VLSVLGKAAPWATSPTVAIHELQGLGLGYTEKTFYVDWKKIAPKFKGVESPTPFEQRYAYYYTVYLRDPDGNKYRETLVHYSDEALTRDELRDELQESWVDEAEPYTAGTPAERGTPYMFRIRGASVKTGWQGMRPL